MKLYGPGDWTVNKKFDLTLQPCEAVTYKKDIELKNGQCFVKNAKDKSEIATKLKNTVKWLGLPDFNIVYEDQRLDTQAFGLDSVKNETALIRRSFDPSSPSIMQA